MCKVLILLADGCEETEAVTTIDLLVRANIKVTTSSITNNLDVTCSRGVMIKASTTLAHIFNDEFDAIILPGGLKGSEHLRDNQKVIEIINRQHQAGKVVAAICAAPAVVLLENNLFVDAKMTGFPSFKKHYQHWQHDRVYYDDKHKILTSQGLGTSIDFALKLITLLKDAKTAKQVADELVLPAEILNNLW